MLSWCLDISHFLNDLFDCNRLTSKSTFSPSGIFGAAMFDMNLLTRRNCFFEEICLGNFTDLAEEVNLLWLRLRLIWKNTINNMNISRTHLYWTFNSKKVKRQGFLTLCCWSGKNKNNLVIKILSICTCQRWRTSAVASFLPSSSL